MANLYFPISGLFCIVLIVILFFSKERIKSKETRLYGVMILSSLIDVILVIIELLIGYYNYNEFTYSILKIINKIDFIHYILWTTLLFLYVYFITYNNLKHYKVIKKIVIVLDIIFVLLEFILPVDIINNNGTMGVLGLSANLVYIVAMAYLIIIVIILLANINKIFHKKYTPIISFVVLMVVASICRVVDPTLIIIPTIIVYINLIMYFTIENPDVKMIEELTIAKHQAEKANNAKTDFLSSMSH